jgi:chromosomal replication initiation ATPase DnaA
MNAIERIIADTEAKLTEIYMQPVKVAIITQTLNVDDTMRFVTLIVCNALNVRFDEVFEKNRRSDLVEARKFIYYYAKSRYGIGPVRAAQYFHQDHTSAIHSNNDITDKLSIGDARTRLSKRLIEAEFEDLKTKTHDTLD